jgi:phosphoribosylanthranilate isomerase
MMPVPYVKICCITSPEEAALAIESGAHAIGLVSRMPSGPGVIDEQRIAQIAASIPKYIDSFLLTSETTVKGILEQHARCRTTTVQFVDKLSTDVLGTLSDAMGEIKRVQVIHVNGDEAVEEALRVSALVDAILLDSGKPDLAVKELGGTGRTHDWSISRKIVECVECPVLLAGGLNWGNVDEAMRSVGPMGIDVCSGVRSDGKLDEAKLKQLMHRLVSSATA